MGTQGKKVSLSLFMMMNYQTQSLILECDWSFTQLPLLFVIRVWPVSRDATEQMDRR